MHKKVWDTMIMELAVLYVVSPIMIFLLGWVKKPIAVLGCILCIYFQAKLIKELSNGYTEDIKTQRGRLFWVISCLVLVLWVLFSGIGGFSYQTGDFFVRNPMFHDLLDHPWPIYFNLSEQPPLVHEVIGSVHEDTATYVYYFAWWLPVAAFTKLFHVAAAVSDVLLFVWALLGVFLTFYCLVRYFKTYSYWILSAFVLFGGMDFAIYVFTRLEFPNKGHVEWWAGYFQYSASSSQLYWVFNQSIPIWLILSLLLLTYKEKQRLGLCSLAFAYSPFATIGIVPIAVASCLKLKGGVGRNSARCFGIALR